MSPRPKRMLSRLSVGRVPVTLLEMHVGSEITHERISSVALRVILSNGVTAEGTLSQLEAGDLAAKLLNAAAKVAS